MEYSISRLSKMAGISTRALRHYDQIGLLKPVRISSSGHRIYSQREVDRLQQILFYRELEVPLEHIRTIILAADFDQQKALEEHLQALFGKRDRLNQLIETLQMTIAVGKGDEKMSDEEKFIGFKEDLVKKNENKYGGEIRSRYGEEAVNASNQKLLGLSQSEYREVQTLSEALNQKLKEACQEGSPGSALAQEACDLHKKWLCYYWPSYSKNAHLELGRMYVEDSRFAEYYERIYPGCAIFLRDALEIYCR